MKKIAIVGQEDDPRVIDEKVRLATEYPDCEIIVVSRIKDVPAECILRSNLESTIHFKQIPELMRCYVRGEKNPGHKRPYKYHK